MGGVWSLDYGRVSEVSSRRETGGEGGAKRGIYSVYMEVPRFQTVAAGGWCGMPCAVSRCSVALSPSSVQARQGRVPPAGLPVCAALHCAALRCNCAARHVSPAVSRAYVPAVRITRRSPAGPGGRRLSHRPKDTSEALTFCTFLHPPRQTRRENKRKKGTWGDRAFQRYSVQGAGTSGHANNFR